MVGRSRHAHTERNSKTYIRACTYTQADNQTFQSRSGFAHATDPPEVPGLCAELFFFTGRGIILGNAAEAPVRKCRKCSPEIPQKKEKESADVPGA